jgi:hypothetical protein
VAGTVPARVKRVANSRSVEDDAVVVEPDLDAVRKTTQQSASPRDVEVSRQGVGLTQQVVSHASDRGQRRPE